jgi:conjugative transfer region protein TrbK
MGSRFRSLTAIARASGVAIVAVVIIAVSLQFRDAPSPLQTRRAEPAAAQDSPSEELKRCQVLAAQAKDDATCEAAWAERRRRFLTYQPTSKAAPAPGAPPIPSDR